MFYALRPEVPGSLGDSAELDYSVTPYKVVRLHVEMDGWMGDDLCAVAGNNYFVTEPLRDSIMARHSTGCQFEPMTVSRSELFEELQSEVELPRFLWMKVSGQSREDDFGIGAASDGSPTLIVSDAALFCLREHSLRQSDVTPLNTAE